MQRVGLFRSALLLLSVCLAGWLSLFAAADQGVPSNPFVDVMVSAPPFKPFPTKQPWNTFEIPELPDRFAVDFVWNNRYRGRWIYDYIIRKTRIEYYLSATATVGFLFNYQILKERFMHYETEGNPGGAKCSLFDLKVPYARMFSPRSWRNIDVFDISTEDTDFYEKDRKAAAVMVSGTFDNLALALRCWTNGSVSAVTIGSDHWRFSNFIDWEANDQYAIDTNGDLQFVEPRMPCVYAGELDKEYAQEFQHQIPFTLFKPTQDKALRKAGADAQQAPKAGGKGKAAGKARFRQTHHSFAKPLARWSTGRIRRHRVRPAPGAFALPEPQE